MTFSRTPGFGRCDQRNHRNPLVGLVRWPGSVCLGTRFARVVKGDDLPPHMLEHWTAGASFLGRRTIVEKLPRAPHQLVVVDGKLEIAPVGMAHDVDALWRNA